VTRGRKLRLVAIAGAMAIAVAVTHGFGYFWYWRDLALEARYALASTASHPLELIRKGIALRSDLKHHYREWNYPATGAGQALDISDFVKRDLAPFTKSDDIATVLNAAGFELLGGSGHLRLSNDLACVTEVLVTYGEQDRPDRIEAKIWATCL